MAKQPAPLATMSMSELARQVFEEAVWIVENLIPLGITIIAAPPKSAKSFLALQIALCVAFGIPLMGIFPVTQGEVLCLFLEDTFRRIQGRMRAMEESLDIDIERSKGGVHFGIRAETLGQGLLEQIDGWVAAHPDITLIVIDTLQKVRDNVRTDNVYASDYAALGKLKEYADDHKLSICVIHHTKKAPACDPFDSISGSYGISGAADSSLVIQRSNHMEKEAKLHVTGRDMESAIHLIEFDGTIWNYIKAIDDESNRIPSCILEIEAFMAALESPDWRGTASDLIEAAGIDGVTASALSRALKANARYLGGHGIRYASRREAKARVITLTIS